MDAHGTVASPVLTGLALAINPAASVGTRNCPKLTLNIEANINVVMYTDILAMANASTLFTFTSACIATVLINVVSH